LKRMTIGKCCSCDVVSSAGAASTLCAHRSECGGSDHKRNVGFPHIPLPQEFYEEGPELFAMDESEVRVAAHCLM
jgi:hypothetical protein